MNGGLKMNKITVIELLNKIANGEDVPQEIRYNGDNYLRKYDKIENCYYYDGLYNTLSNIIYLDSSDLNDEIEIIEDTDNKIEKIDVRYGLKEEDVGFENETYLLAVVGEQATKINEIIDYINNNDNHIPRID